MDLDTDKADMRREMLEEQRHEELMRYDEDYFCEWVLDNFFIAVDHGGYVDIQDVLTTLNKECIKYDYSIDILLDYMKDI